MIKNKRLPVWSGVLLLGWLPAFSSFGAEARHFLHGHVPAVVAGLRATGFLPATNELQLAIGLPLRNEAALDSLIHELYNPGSRQFHRYLTPEEFTAQFGPSAADYQAVIAFALTNGLRVIKTYPNRMVLDVAAPVADIEQAFGVTLKTYRHPKEQRDFYAPSVEPSVPTNLPVADLWGLSDYARPHPLAIVANATNAAPSTYNGSGVNGSYRGADFRNAYVPGTALTGVGQTVAVVEFDGYYSADIVNYEQQCGYASVPLTNVLVNVTGTPGYSGIADAVLEVSLDIELAIAMAPGLSRVMVYEGSNPYDVYNQISSDNVAKQITSSWSFDTGPGQDWLVNNFGNPVAGTTLDSLLKKMVAQGQAFFQASGDSDAYTGSAALNSSTGPIPVDSIYVTSVGGTSLTMNGTGASWASESVWNWNNSGNANVGSSGGVSGNYAIPSWQTNVSMAFNGGSATYRNLPDVAMPAEAIYVIYNNGNVSGYVGGTSAAAPLWAGFCALINQQYVATTGNPIGFLNPVLYGLAATTNYAHCFHDITTGNNIGANTAGLYEAVAGYDLCTGLGSPSGINLINALVPPFIALTNAGWALQFESATPTNGAIDPGETVTVSFSFKNQGTLATSNLVATLQPNAGVLAPDGPQTYGALPAYGGYRSASFTFTAAGSCGSNLVAAVQLQDGTNNFGTFDFLLPLGKSSGLTENFDGVTPPALPPGWTTTNLAGTVVKWVATNAVSSSSPNSAFIKDTGSSSENALVSPVFAITTTNAQLSFQHYYSFDYHLGSSHIYRDGGVLEIKIGSGAFTDILAAGGSFVSGGYNNVINTVYNNPLNGRSAWVGPFNLWQTVTVNLPATAAGQSIQLRWNCGTDSSNGGAGAVGWFVDTVSVADAPPACVDVQADIAVGQSLANASLPSGQNLVYTITLTNAGPQAAENVVLVDTLPANGGFVSASPGGTFTAGTVVFSVGAMDAGSATNFLVTVSPGGGNVFTNLVSAGTITPETSTANNAVALVSMQTVLPPAVPNITAESSNTNGSFNLSLAGTPGATYILETTTNLFSVTGWQPIATNTLDTNGVWQFSDADATNFAQRFYRLKLAQ